MALSLDALLERDAEFVARCAAPHQAALAAAVIDSDLPLTGKALYMLFSKCLMIKDSIFAQAESDNVHATMILYRSYIEHFLKHQYIFYRARELGSDEVGEQYYGQCQVRNELDSAQAQECRSRIFGQGFAYPDYWSDIPALFPEPGKEIGNLGEFEAVVRQFYAPRILEYLSVAVPASGAEESDREIYREMAFGYIEYKSHVYGEPWTDRELLVMSEEPRRGDFSLATCIHVYDAQRLLARASEDFLKTLDPMGSGAGVDMDSWRLG